MIPIKEGEHFSLKDRVVLKAIYNGHTTTREVRKNTFLSNRQVNYYLNKFEDEGYITLKRPNGERTKEIVKGQERSFVAPKEAELTEDGRKVVENLIEEEVETEDGPEPVIEEHREEEIEELLKEIEVLKNRVRDLREQRDKLISDLEGERADLISIVERLEGDSESCLICGESNQMVLEKHHVIPRRYGGSDNPDNLITVCANCHRVLERVYDTSFFRTIGVDAPEEEDE